MSDSKKNLNIFIEQDKFIDWKKIINIDIMILNIKMKLNVFIITIGIFQ